MIILIPGLQVQAANAMAGQHFVSTAPVMQASLFGHALGREVGRQPDAVAVLHHDAQLLAESGPGFYGRYHPQQRRGAVFIDDTDYSSKNKHALSLQPTFSAHLRLTVILRFRDAPIVSDVQRFLWHARFSGGQVIGHDRVQAFDSEEALLKHAKAGWWLIERSDLVDPAAPVESLLGALGRRPRRADLPKLQTVLASTTTLDPDDQMIELDPSDEYGQDDEDSFGFAPNGDEDESETIDDASPAEPLDLGSGWLAPAVLGYAATTDFARRTGARGDYLHAFGESLVGLVQFVSARRWRDRQAPIPWWQHGWLQDDVFIVTQDNGLFLESQADPRQGDFKI